MQSSEHGASGNGGESGSHSASGGHAAPVVCPCVPVDIADVADAAPVVVVLESAAVDPGDVVESEADPPVASLVPDDEPVSPLDDDPSLGDEQAHTHSVRAMKTTRTRGLYERIYARTTRFP